MFAEFEDVFLLYSFYIQGSLSSMLLNNHQRSFAYERHDVSPSPNILIEFSHALCALSILLEPSARIRTYAVHTSSTVMSLILAIAYATCGIVAGSLRPLTIMP